MDFRGERGRGNKDPVQQGIAGGLRERSWGLGLFAEFLDIRSTSTLDVMPHHVGVWTVTKLVLVVHVIWVVMMFSRCY